MLANLLHVSGALAMVVAGILIGNWTRYTGFSQQSQRYLDHFWEMLDHFLNSLLFILIGLAIFINSCVLARVNLNFPCYSSVLNLSLCQRLVAIPSYETLP